MSDSIKKAASASLNAGASIQMAVRDTNAVIDAVDAVANELTDPAERIEWQEIRKQWIEIRRHVNRALEAAT